MFIAMTQAFANAPFAAETNTMAMVNFAAYGGLTTAINGGASIQAARSSGWLRNGPTGENEQRRRAIVTRTEHSTDEFPFTLRGLREAVAASGTFYATAPTSSSCSW